MKKYLTFVAFLVLAVVLASPFSVSAKTKAGAKPGSFFYFFDKAFEKADLFFTFNPEKKAKKALDNAEERLAEAEESANENNQEAVTEAVENYQKNISLAGTEVKLIKDETKTKNLLSIIASSTSNHKEVLEKVLNKVPEDTKQAIQKVIEASKKGQEEATKEAKEPKKEVPEIKQGVKETKNEPKNKKDEQKKEIEKLKKEVEKQPNVMTKEQIAIKMATDIEYVGSSLDKNIRQEIKSNWDSIMKHYSGKRGKDTIENMYNDIMDAYYKWKNWQQYELESAKCTAELNERYEKALQKHKDIARNITSGQFLTDSSGTSSSDAFGEMNSLKPESCYKADSLSGIEPDLYSQPIHQSISPIPDTYTATRSILDSFEKQKQESRLRELEMERFSSELKQKQIENSRFLNCTVENGYYSNGVCNHF